MPTRIIIADNDLLQRKNLHDALIARGYQIVGEADNGLDVIKLARAVKPTLIIMDTHLPHMDGIAAAEILIRAKIAPVILSSAFSDAQSIQHAVDAGVSSYLLKPLRENEIVAAIEIAIARYRAYRSLDEQKRALAEQLQVRKMNEHARGILQEKQGLAEQEALRKSMQARNNLPPPSEPFSLPAAADALLQEIWQLERGSLSIGTSLHQNALTLIQLLKHYHELHPQIKISLVPSSTEDVLARLLTQEINLACVPEHIVQPGLATHVWQQNTIIYIIAVEQVRLSRAAEAFLALLDPS